MRRCMMPARTCSTSAHERNPLMTRLAIALFGLLATATAAAAENLIEAGEWKVTSTAVINGTTSPPQSKSRCITPEQAANVATTFGPVSGTVNSDCGAPTIETAGKTLKWRLQCRGQLDIDATGEFTFDSSASLHRDHHLEGQDGGRADQRCEVGHRRRARRRLHAVAAGKATYRLRMISAQTRSAFVATENRRTLFRIMRYSMLPRCRSASICSLVPPPNRAR